MWWYCIIEGKQQGPLTDEQLWELARQKQLKSADMVWNETMGDQWVEAHTVPGIFGELPQSDDEPPPPVPAEASARVYPAAEAISCTSPFAGALEYTKSMLFRPFDIGKWFALGASAWLATMLDQSAGFQGGGTSDIYSGLQDLQDEGTGIDPNSILQMIREFWTQWGDPITLYGSIALVVGTMAWLIAMWLKSRGHFMLLHNVVYDSAEVTEPWRTYHREGNSFFGWQVAISFISMVVVVLWLVCVAVFVVLPTFRANEIMISSIPGLVLSVMGVGLISVVAAYIDRFGRDFVVPLMFIHRIGVMQAWGRFMTTFKSQTGKFVLYGLFYFVLSIGANVAKSLLILITCCIAGCLIGIPYVGAVVLLPFTVFFRTYSMGYISQYGPEFDVWAVDDVAEDS